jgi:hypothetical protein
MISFCVPSRGRPELAKRLVDTANSTAKYQTEFLFYLNEDDPTLEQYRDLIDEKHYTIGPNQSTCFSWNQMASKSKNDIVMLMGDDVQVQTQDWDDKIKMQFDQFDDKILMVVPSDGRRKGNAKNQETEPTLWPDESLPAAHFAVHKNWIDTVGYLAPPFFWHFYVDTYTQKVARKLNRCMFLPTVVFKAKKLFDSTATNVRSHLNIVKRDDFVWTKVRDRHLMSDVDLLQDFIKGKSTS